MDETTRRALAAAVPAREPVEVEDTEGSANPGNRTVRVRFDDGDGAYLKVATDGDRTRLARAAGTLRYAGERTTVGVPTVLAADPRADPPYLLTAPLSGTPAVREWERSGADEREALLWGVGRTLASVHEARFERAGRLGGGDDAGLDVEATAWPAVVTGMIDDDGSDSERFAGFAERAREIVETHRDELALDSGDGPGADRDRPAPALLHNDLRPENSFWDGERVGLIDWEQAMVGDPTLDVVKTEGRYLGRPDVPDRERLRAALWDGYRDRAGALPPGFERRRAVYRVVTFLSVAQGFDEWAPAVDEPTPELAAWVREEFAERVDQVE
jgi:fructosamine-3-kinase